MASTCGCRIRDTKDEYGIPCQEIVYCPLHEAAEDMLATLGRVSLYLGTVSYPTLDDRISLGRLVIGAIAKARGQQPAEDSEMPLGPIQAPARGLKS